MSELKKLVQSWAAIPAIPAIPAISRHPNSTNSKNSNGWESDIDFDDPAVQQAARVARLVAKGVVPAHYTASTNCRTCGPVPIFEGCPPKVLGCPWCWAGSSPETVERRSPGNRRERRAI